MILTVKIQLEDQMRSQMQSFCQTSRTSIIACMRIARHKTLAISAVLPDGEAAPDAYSALFHSQEVVNLLSCLTVTVE